MGFVIDIPAPPTFPKPVTPTVRPGIGGPLVFFLELLAWLELMAQANQDGFQDPNWANWLSDPLEAKQRIAVGVMCKECCDIVKREGEKTIRKIGPNLDKVSPKTSDDAKRARLRKRTRQPAW